MTCRHSATKLKRTIYTPHGIEKGWQLWSKIIKNLINSRELIYRLFVRDLKVRFRQSLLGYVWAMLPPIATVAIFTYLSNRRILPVGDTPVPYTSFALWNIGVWQLFSGCLMSSTRSLVLAGQMITKINFPKESLIIASIGQPLVDFMIRLLPVALVFFWQDVLPPWQAILIPFVLAPLIMLSLSLGFLLSLTNLVFRDVGNALSIILAFGIFTAPVLYPPPTQWPLSLVNILNPISPFLIAMQDLIAYGSLSSPLPFVIYSCIALALFFISIYMFNLVVPHVIERA